MKILAPLTVSDRKHREVSRVARDIGISPEQVLRNALDLYLRQDREENPPRKKNVQRRKRNS